MTRLTTAALILGVAGGAISMDTVRAESGLQAAFGNTIVSTYPDGRQAKLWLEADGTYKAAGRRGKPSSGRWNVKGEQICLRQSRPFPAPKSYCTPLVDGAVGTRWSGKAVTGEPVKLELAPGRGGTGTNSSR